jgi:general secretion pathway protein K
MVSISEWKKVAGVNPKIYKALAPYLIALPETTPLNLNTCSPVLLKTLAPNLKDEDIQKIIFTKGDQGFDNEQELFSILQVLNIPIEKTTVTSQYFILDIQMKSPSGRITHLNNLFFRPMASQNQLLVSLMHRSEL